MTNDQILHTITASYYSINADLILGKNLPSNIQKCRIALKELNSRIDCELLSGIDSSSYIKLAYWFYKLKDETEAALKAQVNPSY